MNPRTHARFLRYLESLEYFSRPDLPRLDRDSFAACDAELTSMLLREADGSLSGEEANRVRALRRVLLRD